MITTLLTIAVLLTATPQVYSVEYNGDIYEYVATYNSESEIGSATDENFIVTLDGEVIFIRDIVRNGK